MTNRERILAIIKGRKPDRVPWFADLDYWYGAAARAGTLDDKYKGDGYFRLLRDLGAGFYLQGYMPFRVESDGVRFETAQSGNKTVTTMKTPKGDLTEVTQWLPTSSSSGYVKHFVETSEDLEAFQYYIEHMHHAPDYTEAARRVDLVGDNGVVLCYTPRTPYMQMVTTYAGLTNFVYLLADCPDETRRLLDLMITRFDEGARLAVDSPAEFIMIPQNLSAEAVGLANYMEFLRPFEKQWIGWIREAGKTSLIHMDGTLRGLLTEVARTGFDIIEAVTPAPAGDMTMEEIAGVVGGGAIVWGGLPGVMFTPKVTDREFDDHVIHTLDIMRESPRYVLGVADQVPPDGLLSRVARVAELCDAYGKYK